MFQPFPWQVHHINRTQSKEFPLASMMDLFSSLSEACSRYHEGEGHKHGAGTYCCGTWSMGSKQQEHPESLQSTLPLHETSEYLILPNSQGTSTSSTSWVIANMKTAEGDHQPETRPRKQTEPLSHMLLTNKDF